MSRDSRRGRGRRSARPKRDRSVDLERYRPYVPDWDAFVQVAARPEPTVFRVNQGRISPDQLVERLSARGFRLSTPSGMPGFFQVLEGPCPVSMTLEHWLGMIYVQQASTGVAAPALGPRPGERVLDLCAAPGGKTTHIAQLMEDRGCVVACEISESRTRGLLGNVYRLGHSNVLVVAGDGRDFPEGPLFDRVLVDAPCSGEGTLRRRAGKAPDQSKSFLGYVTGAQRALLEKAVRVTRPGGIVMYVTCTFAPEENEAVVSEALERLPVALEPLDLPVPHAPGLTAFEDQRYDPALEGAARIYPHHLDSGGLFLAKLRRLDGDPPESTRASSARGPSATSVGKVDVDAGWSSVPALFPDAEQPDPARPGEDAQVGGTTEGITPASCAAQMRDGLAEVVERFGIGADFGDVGWTMRGGRAWLHTVGEWPLEAWRAGSWRAVSVGIRALDFDTRQRPRPTNDFLRWAGPGSAVLDLDRSQVTALLRGEAIPCDVERRGPIALGFEGDVVGRGAVTGSGLKSEIPKARALDLRRVLETDSAT